MRARTTLEWDESLSRGVAPGERTALYGESYAFVPSELDGSEGLGEERTEPYLNSGLTWLAKEDPQWDMRVGFGLNDAAEGPCVSAGVAFRMR